MDRHQQTDLSNWLHSPRRKPLIVRGARQVGKSTLVELLAKEEGRSLSTVNLERHPDLGEVFASNDPSAIVNLLQSTLDTPLSADGILFLDEIQAAPAAIASLRYFLEEMPHLPVVAAGPQGEIQQHLATRPECNASPRYRPAGDGPGGRQGDAQRLFQPAIAG